MQVPLDLSKIKISVTDSTGKSFYTLTGTGGEFQFYVPYGKYILNMDETILDGNFSLAQNNVNVNLKEGSESLYYSFYVIERQRKINIKKFDSNGAVDTIHKKPLSKLEVDRALFKVLDDDFKRQEESITKEIEDLKKKLNNTTGPAEKAKIEKQIQEKQTKLAEVQKKRKETQKKYSDITGMINQENEKNGEPDPVKNDSKTNSNFENSNDSWGENVIIDQPMPSGLFYKVQIGVYKNNIDPAIFQGITPITGETTPNGISYAAGMFKKLKEAQEAKNFIKGLGYTDAFIAAYNNGVKISISEASKLEK